MPTDISKWSTEKCIDTICKAPISVPCVSGGYVICTSAIRDIPIQIEKSNGVTEINGKYKLTEKDIALKGRFDGCRHKGICMISESQIEDQEWKDTGIYKDTDNGLKVLDYESSYMICTFGPGIIYFIDAGQSYKDFIDQISADEIHLLKLVQWLKYMEIGDIYDSSNENYIEINGIFYITLQNAHDGYITIGYGHAIQSNEDAEKYGLNKVKGFEDFDFGKKNPEDKIDKLIDAYKLQYINSLPGPAILSQEAATLLLIEDVKEKQKDAISKMGGISEKSKYNTDELNALTSVLFNGNEYKSDKSLSYHLIKSHGEFKKEEALNMVETANANGVYDSQGNGIYRRRLMEINIYYNGNYTFYDDDEIDTLIKDIKQTLSE